jgi:hypothetical protein
VRSIGPKECGNLTRHLHGFVYTQPLQSLNVKNSIIEITISAFVAVDTLPLAIYLSSHDDSPIPAPGGANKVTLNQMSGLLLKCELKTGLNYESE